MNQKTLFEQPIWHICLVAKQPVPNLSPVLDSRTRPQKVLLAHTESFSESAKNLAQVYEAHGIESTFFVLRDAFSFQKLREDFSRLLTEMKVQEMPIKPWLNLTAGTKPMSLVLYDVGHHYACPAYYLNTDDSLSWYEPSDWPKIQLEDKIGLKDFLLAHHLKVEQTHQPMLEAKVQLLLDEVMANIQLYKNAFPRLNAYASSAYGSENLRSMPIERRESKSVTALIDLFAQAGLLVRQPNYLEFVSEKARFFANGGWLEEYVHSQLRLMKANLSKLQDFACGVKVRNQSTDVLNEIDNLALVNNNLYVIECKTKKTPPSEQGAMLYKLETLTEEMGGILAQGMLVSLFPLSRANRNRAEQYHIQIVSFEDLPDLRRHLYNWFVANKRF